MTAEPTHPSNIDLKKTNSNWNDLVSGKSQYISREREIEREPYQLLLNMRASLYSVELTNESSTIPVSRLVLRLQCMMTSENTANKAGECEQSGKCFHYESGSALIGLRHPFATIWWLRSITLPAKMYITPVISTALIWRFIIPKVPSRAADANRMTHTMAQEMDKLCISACVKRAGDYSVINSSRFRFNKVSLYAASGLETTRFPTESESLLHILQALAISRIETWTIITGLNVMVEIVWRQTHLVAIVDAGRSGQVFSASVAI